MTRTIALVLAYDGTGLAGWQRQADRVSVQGLIEDALARIEGGPVVVHGAGRTDAGVHAAAQVCSFRLAHSIPAGDLRRALNAMLPAEIRVERAEVMPDLFHARYSALGKTYRYTILNDDGGVPFLSRYAWHLRPALDVESMAACARLLEGTHDFGAFQSTGSVVRSPVRTIAASEVSEVDAARATGWPVVPRRAGGAPRLVVYEVTADGFLRHMVRAIVGSLVEVGAGRRSVSWFEALVAGQSREAAGPTAPAHGLCLASVRYGSERGGGALAGGPASL